MNEIIYKRKSVRRFKKHIFSQDEIEKIRSIISSAQPLCPESPGTVEIQSNKAAYCLVFCGKDLVNIGFIGQQISLGLAQIGIGSCWKMGKPAGEIKSGDPFAISMLFGIPDEPLFRSRSEFKRKKLSEISEGTDERLEAARLAPSGLNEQDWYFIADCGNIHCYRKKPNILLSPIKNKLGRIDMGIALCHIAQESTNFDFQNLIAHPNKKGYMYMGTVVDR